MVVGISMVRDEADVVATTVSHMRSQVDQVIVADNGSVDGTREILDSLDVIVLDDPDPAYMQSEKMSHLARIAAEHGAEWVVPFDADEVWLPRRCQRIADLLEEMPTWALIAEATLYDHVASGLDPDLEDPIEQIQWRRPDPAPLPKVACRVIDGLTIEQGNHGASYVHTHVPPRVSGLLNIRHFPYRSIEQFVRKIRNGAQAYAATDLPPDVGAHWRQYGEILDAHGEDGLAEVFRTWYWRRDPGEEIRIEGEYQPPLIHDPCPVSLPFPG